MNGTFELNYLDLTEDAQKRLNEYTCKMLPNVMEDLDRPVAIFIGRHVDVDNPPVAIYVGRGKVRD